MDARLRELLASPDPAAVRQGCEILLSVAPRVAQRVSGCIDRQLGQPLDLLEPARALFLPETRAWATLCLLSAIDEMSAVSVLDLSLIDGRQHLASLAPLRSARCLEQLTLTDNSMLRALSDLHGLPALHTLSLRACSWLQNLSVLPTIPDLASLTIEHCDAIGDYSPLTGCRALRQLHLQARRLPKMALVGRLPHLTGLSLTGALQVSDLDALAEVHGLRSLALSGLGYLRDISALQGLMQLETLSITRAARLSSLSGLGPLSLRQLRLTGCAQLVTLSGLCALSALEELDLGGAYRLTSLAPISGAPRLRALRLDGLRALRDRDVLGGLSALEELSLRDQGVLECLHHLRPLRRLRFLDLAGTAQSTLESLAQLPALQRLDISKNLGEVRFSDLAGAPVQQLSAQHCSLVSLAGIEQLPELVSLDLQYNAQLEDIWPLSKAGRLERLDLRGCHSIRDVRPLLALPALRHVRFPEQAAVRGREALREQLAVQREQSR